MDGKRSSVPGTARVSNLADITMYSARRARRSPRERAAKPVMNSCSFRRKNKKNVAKARRPEGDS